MQSVNVSCSLITKNRMGLEYPTAQSSYYLPAIISETKIENIATDKYNYLPVTPPYVSPYDYAALNPYFSITSNGNGNLSERFPNVLNPEKNELNKFSYGENDYFLNYPAQYPTPPPLSITPPTILDKHLSDCDRKEFNQNYRKASVIMKVEDHKIIEIDSDIMRSSIYTGDVIRTKTNKDIIHEDLVCKWENCFQSFDTLEALASHVTQMHAIAGIDGLYYCKWTGCHRSERGFNARYKMLVHVRTHTKEKPHQCSKCEKSFSRAENLKIHIRSHSGEKPYVCPVEGCNKAYSNSSDRFKHTRTHSTDKPYICKIPGCEKRYTDPSSLRKHVKTFKHQQNMLTDQDRNLIVRATSTATNTSNTIPLSISPATLFNYNKNSDEIINEDNMSSTSSVWTKSINFECHPSNDNEKYFNNIDLPGYNNNTDYSPINKQHLNCSEDKDLFMKCTCPQANNFHPTYHNDIIIDNKYNSYNVNEIINSHNMPINLIKNGNDILTDNYWLNENFNSMDIDLPLDLSLHKNER